MTYTWHRDVIVVEEKWENAMASISTSKVPHQPRKHRFPEPHLEAKERKIISDDISEHQNSQNFLGGEGKGEPCPQTQIEYS